MQRRKNGIAIDTTYHNRKASYQRKTVKVYSKDVRVEVTHYPKLHKVGYVELYNEKHHAWIHTKKSDEEYIKQREKEGYRQIGDVYYAEVPA